MNLDFAFWDREKWKDFRLFINDDEGKLHLFLFYSILFICLLTFFSFFFYPIEDCLSQKINYIDEYYLEANKDALIPIQYHNQSAQSPTVEISMAANNIEGEQADEPEQVESSEQSYEDFGNYGSQEYPSEENGPHFEITELPQYNNQIQGTQIPIPETSMAASGPEQCSMEQSISHSPSCQTNESSLAHQLTPNQSAFTVFQLNHQTEFQVSIPLIYFIMAIPLLNELQRIENWPKDLIDMVRAERRKYLNNQSARRRRRERKARKEGEEQLQLKDYKIIQKPKTTGKIKTTTKSKN